jgi:hypothetical protein
MKYSLPPFNEIEKREFFEQKILDFSTVLFRNPKLGLSLSISLNLLYIYAYFKSKSVLSIMLYLFLAYLILSIALSKLLGLNRDK